MTTRAQDGPVLVADGLGRAYGDADARVHALRDVSLAVEAGTFAAVMGPSGSGKSTLLNLLGGLDEPTSGTVRVGGAVLGGLSDDDLTDLRAARIGFVFQFYALLGSLTAAENVALPAIIAGADREDAAARALELLERVGVADGAGRRPAALSGGQQQRVAIARALVQRPDVVLADEPTGSLDTDSGGEVLDVLRRLADEGQTVVMVTHDPLAAARADRVLFLRDGHLVHESAGGDARAIAGTLAELRAAGAVRA